MRMFISGYNWIPNHLNTLRVDVKIFVSAKKYLPKKKFLDTCGHGPKELLKVNSPSDWLSKRGCLALVADASRKEKL